jgi:hypothetical protein
MKYLSEYEENLIFLALISIIYPRNVTIQRDFSRVFEIRISYIDKNTPKIGVAASK